MDQSIDFILGGGGWQMGLFGELGSKFFTSHAALASPIGSAPHRAGPIYVIERKGLNSFRSGVTAPGAHSQARAMKRF